MVNENREEGRGRKEPRVEFCGGIFRRCTEVLKKGGHEGPGFGEEIEERLEGLGSKLRGKNEKNQGSLPNSNEAMVRGKKDPASSRNEAVRQKAGLEGGQPPGVGLQKKIGELNDEKRQRRVIRGGERTMKKWEVSLPAKLRIEDSR